MDERSDEELIAMVAAGAGDGAAALEALLSRHYEPARRLARKVLGDPAAAEDAVAEAFVRLSREAARFRAGASFGPWFRTILWNAVRDSVRRRRTRERHERRAAEARPTGPVVPSTVEDAAIAREVASRLTELDPDLRFALALHFYEGRSFEEIGGIVGCPKRTAQSRVRRGLERLRLSLGAAAVLLAAGALERAIAAEPDAAGLAPEGPPGAASIIARAAVPVKTSWIPVGVGAAIAATGLAAAVLVGSIFSGRGGAPAAGPGPATAAALPADSAHAAEPTPGAGHDGKPGAPAEAAESPAAPGDSSGDRRPAQGASEPAPAEKRPEAPTEDAPVATGLRLRVLSVEDGKPVAGARFLAAGLVASAKGATDADGFAELPKGVLGIMVDDAPRGRAVALVGPIPDMLAPLKEAAKDGSMHLVTPTAGVVTLRLERCGAIRGRVVDEAGAPARAHLVAYEDDVGLGFMGRTGLEVLDRMIAEMTRNGRRLPSEEEMFMPFARAVLVSAGEAGFRPRSADTGEDGAFELTGLTPGVSVAIAVESGRAPVTYANVERVRGDLPRPITISAGVPFEGHVVDAATGAPIPGADVTVRRGYPGNRWEDPRTARTDRDGHFVFDGLAPEHVGVAVESSGYAPEDRGADLARADGRKQTVKLLRAARSLAGRVVNEEGEPIDGAGVTAYFDPGSNQGALTGADGRFAIERCPAGAMALYVSAPGDQYWRAEVSVAADDPGPLEIVLERAGRVRLAVHDAAGHAILPYDVMLYHGRSGGGTRVEGPEGCVQTAGPGKNRVEVKAPGFAPAEKQVLVPKGGEVAVDLTLTRGAAVRGHVVRTDGLPVTGARIFMGGGKPGDDEKPVAVSGEDGAFTVAGLAEGAKLDLTVFSDGLPPAVFWDVLPGEDLRIVLETSELEGAVHAADGTPPAGPRFVRLEGPRRTTPGGWRSDLVGVDVETDAGGRFRLPPVSPGRYKLRCGARREGLDESIDATQELRPLEETVDLTRGSQRIDLVEPTLAAIRVRLTSGGAPLAGFRVCASVGRLSPGQSWVTTDESGAFCVYADLGRGPITIISSQDGTLWKGEVDVAPPETPLEIALGAGEIKGRLTGDLSRLGDEIWFAGGYRTVPVPIHADGRFSIRFLKAGRYQLYATSGEQLGMPIDLAEGEKKALPDNPVPAEAPK